MNNHIAVLGSKGLPAKGGGERVAEAIIQTAIQSRFHVTLYGKKDYCDPIDFGPSLRLVLIKEIQGKHLSGFSFGFLSALHALLFGKYDLIHLHYADFGFLVPLLRLRFKVLVTSHGAEYNRDKWGKIAKLCFRIFEVPFVRYSNICTSVSRRLADYYSEQYKKKVYFIPNGTDLDQVMLLNKESNKKYNIPPNGYILFAAGRIIPSKGCDLLLKANKKLNLKIPLIIVGNAKENGNYQFYLESLSEPNVLFIDFIEKKEELFEIISNSRFFVFPSTYEAMSMMLLEVASLKKGIVCSDISENYDAIGNNAIFFRSGDWEDLDDKIDFAAKNQSMMDELGHKAYEFIKEKRNWRTITENYLELYRCLIQGKPVPSNF
jgi:glycosyltransferase involved in cell wall biosynthesis